MWKPASICHQGARGSQQGSACVVRDGNRRTLYRRILPFPLGSAWLQKQQISCRVPLACGTALPQERQLLPMASMAQGSRRAKSRLSLTPVLSRLSIHPHMSGCLEGRARPRVQGVGVAGLTEAGLG